jgi:hypothetical protein
MDGNNVRVLDHIEGIEIDIDNPPIHNLHALARL